MRDAGIAGGGADGVFAASVLVRAGFDCVVFRTPGRGRGPSPCQAGLTGLRTARLPERHDPAVGMLARGTTTGGASSAGPEGGMVRITRR